MDIKNQMLKLNKKTIGIIAVVILVFLGIIIWFLFQFQKAKTPGKKEISPVKEETQEELLERLTPKDAKPLTEQEKAELKKVLEQLTPNKSKPMTEQEIKETEELLKRLTP